MDVEVGTLLGLCLIALAVLHFQRREVDAGARSMFLGAWRGTTASRTLWAFTELALGGFLLLR